MASQIIPEGLNELLARSRYSGATHDFVKKATAILDDNKLPFFPGYTDHGAEHVRRVLQSQLDLIPELVWRKGILGPDDAVVLTCATVLHDLAMHIQVGGLQSLIRGETPHAPIEWFTRPHDRRQCDMPWPREWKDFLAEALRFGDREVLALFGPPHGDDPTWKVRCPPNDLRDWTEYDRLLVGEFLRRHHPRLAHEIALYGFPGLVDDRDFPILSNTLSPVADLIGVVARSHGMLFRDAVDYLAYCYSQDLRPRGVLPVYLMGLLRIADYLQLDADRAPPVLLHLRHPESPISIDEWNKHGAVAHISYLHADPKAITIDIGTAHSLRTHLQLEDLLTNLQTELDTTSAVLREVYGHVAIAHLNKLELSKIRVRSNLQSEELRKALKYVPTRIRFEAAPEMLSLLIKPLYDNRPEIGLRELMQNAIDAALERRLLLQRFPEKRATLSVRHSDCDVLVELAEGNDTWLLTVSDNGIGMHETTIRGYFLRAGASFRNCQDWKAQFTDSKGRSQVLRSGRFGLGVFATFLLGPRLRVSTRHITDTTGCGYYFLAGHDDDIIEIVRRPMPHGTTIEIPISASVAQRLLSSSWDWYTLSSPVVQRRICRIGHAPIHLRQEFSGPTLDTSPFPTNWRRVAVGGNITLCWTGDRYPALTCNGIRIGAVRNNKHHDTEFPWDGRADRIGFRRPNVAVMDPDGNFPLSLRRDQMAADKLPYDYELYRDILRDVIAYSVVNAPASMLGRSSAHAYYVSHPFQNPQNGLDALPWFCTRHGTAPFDPSLARLSECSHLLISGVFGKDVAWCPDSEQLDYDLAVAIRYSVGWEGAQAGGLNELMRIAARVVESLWGKCECGRIVFSTLFHHEWIDKFQGVNGWTRPEMKPTQAVSGKVYEMTKGRIDQKSGELVSLVQQYQHYGCQGAGGFLMELHIDAVELPEPPESTFSKLWKDTVGNRLVPFDAAERNELYDRLRSNASIGERMNAWLICRNEA